MKDDTKPFLVSTTEDSTEISPSVQTHWARLIRRRQFLQGIGTAAGTVSASPLFGAASERLSRGDVAILRLAATIELIEADLWQQYNEHRRANHEIERPRAKRQAKSIRHFGWRGGGADSTNPISRASRIGHTRPRTSSDSLLLSSRNTTGLRVEHSNTSRWPNLGCRGFSTGRTCIPDASSRRKRRDNLKAPALV